MALKQTELQTLINTNLQSNSNIPAYKHREVEQELVKSIYGGITILSGTGSWEWNLKLYKKSDIVYISGYITNPFFSIRGAGSVVTTIPNPDFASSNEIKIPCVTNSIKPFLIRIVANTIYIHSSLSQFDTIYINGHYKITE